MFFGRRREVVRPLTVADQREALEVCALHPERNVFLASRIEEGALLSPGTVWGYAPEGWLESLVWSQANVVPVECTSDALRAFVPALRGRRHLSSSVFGPAEQVLPLWQALEPYLGPPRQIRACQPSLVARRDPRAAGLALDPAVRRARPEELEQVLPASVAMFTEEIGYPPYTTDDRAYRASVADLIRRGRTLVRTEDGRAGSRVVFKADVGAAAQGIAQVQGVWTAPDRRGRGLATAGMASVVHMLLAEGCEAVHLYVNDYNAPALAVYARVGFEREGTFATVIR